MKKLILLLLVLTFWVQLASKQPYVDGVPQSNNYTISNLLENESIKRFVNDSIQRPPYIPSTIIVRFGPLEDRIVGLTTKISEDTYFIQINKKFPFKVTERALMHEMIHVYQFKTNMLAETNIGLVSWKGDLYTWLIPWGLRPWEIHAEILTDKLFVPEQNN